MINEDLDAVEAYCKFHGEASRLKKREALNVNDESKLSKDKVEANSFMVSMSKDHAKELQNKLLKNARKNEPEIKANETEHFKLFEKNLNFVGMFGKHLGLKLDYEWKKNTLTNWFSFFLLWYTWFNILYTQFLHVKNGNFGGVLEVFAIYGIGFATVFAYVVNFKMNKQITAVMHFAREICLKNDTGSRANVLKLRIMKIHKILIFVTCCGLACIGVFIGYPVKALLIDGELVSIMPIEIVFIDQSTRLGFFIANAIMSVMGVWTVSLILFVNLALFTVVGIYSIQVDMIEEDIKDLNNSWSVATVPFKGYQHILLINICHKQQDMNSYVNKIKEIYDGYIFFSFVFTYGSQIVCLFEIVTNNWISGYGIATGVFICHSIYCCVGTLISVANDRLYSTFQQFKWYNSDLRSQKLYLQLLISVMDFKQLWIGPLAPLNVVTGIQIVKSMYTYYTLLLEFA